MATSNTTYSSAAYANTVGLKQKITQAATALDLRPEAIFGALVEENHDYLIGTVKNWLGDTWVSINSLTHVQLAAAYNFAKEQGKLDKHSGLDKVNVVLNDIGPFNIKIGTAIRLVQEYCANTPAGQDPLNLRQYTNDYPKLVQDLMSGQAAPEVAGLMLKEANAYFEATAEPGYWTNLSPKVKDGLLITYYNFGPVVMEEKRIAKIAANGGKYEPQPGEDVAGGENHVHNAQKIGQLFGNAPYGDGQPPAQYDGFSVGASSPLRGPSVSFVTYQEPYLASLKKGGSLSDIVALEKAKGNLISADDIKLVNNLQNLPDSHIPADTPLMVPVRSGDWLTITRADVSLSFNRVTGENTALIHSPHDNTTVLMERTRDGSGQYRDRFVRTDRASGLVVEEFTKPVESGYGMAFAQPNAVDAFTLEIANTLETLKQSAEDPTAQAGQVAQGLVASGGSWKLSYDANALNNDQSTGAGIDNTSAAAATQILADGWRPGNGNTVAPVIDPHGNLLGSGLYDSSAELIGNWLNSANSAAQVTLPTDPLVLDLNGNGVKLTQYADDPVLFDADHDGGSREQTGWASREDGLVVMDRNGNGKIDDMGELLSEYFGGAAGTNGQAGTKPFRDGFAALKSLDSNNDNLFDSRDAAWNTVKIWVDANHDGKSWVDANGNGIIDAGEASELKTFAQLGITQISLVNQAQSGEVRDGNEVLARGSFTINGQTREAIAANFLANPNGSISGANGSGTVVNTQGGGKASATSAYVAGNAAGESIDVTAKGVRNAAGAGGNDALIGDAGNNWLAGAQGSDTLQGAGGNDTLIGGEGNDLAVFVGARDDYTLAWQSDGRLAVSRQGESVILQDIEAVQFGADRYALPASGTAGQPVTLTPLQSLAAAQLLAATMPLLRTASNDIAAGLLGQPIERNGASLFGAAVG